MTLYGSLADAWLNIYPLLLNLISALVIISVGYLAARVVGWLITSALKLAQVDSALKQVGFTGFLEKADIKRTPSELIGDIFYWVLIFVAVVGVAKIYGLAVDAALVTIFNFVSLVFLAAIILGTGLFFAALLSHIVRFLAVNFGIEGAKSSGRFIYYIVVIFTLLTVLAEFGIKTELIAGKLDVIIGAFGLAAAIAFGLGCKDMAADFLYNLFKGK
ncbi:hypothetical protein A2311_00755 [candidate division WOR-1 bacterium RIFOXYB2_FULL_48_7]|uniref:Uncharacterized protein n=1 Tax=candidate division WOR-1 bacterium RIFOXYB2_FULL_48_7 TaxID=1802583 RepID=A0A1F4TK19_UNCSA|nr:MAG: hypothetical protein A2311_00755 [candidate division WOR-1 bacterium RIFOXYB2_FULL_48_7]